MVDGSNSDLDYSDEEPGAVAAATLEAGDKYDPRRQEDGARKAIAYGLISLLWLVVGAMFLLIAFGRIAVADIKEFAVVLGPVVTLVSAATGFYYGTKSTTPPAS